MRKTLPAPAFKKQLVESLNGLLQVSLVIDAISYRMRSRTARPISSRRVFRITKSARSSACSSARIRIPAAARTSGSVTTSGRSCQSSPELRGRVSRLRQLPGDGKLEFRNHYVELADAVIQGERLYHAMRYLPPFQSGRRPGVGGAPAASNCFSSALISVSKSLRSFGISSAKASLAI